VEPQYPISEDIVGLQSRVTMVIVGDGGFVYSHGRKSLGSRELELT
jgi:hypothetical protein